jgi:hypothetical protein
MSRHFSEHRRFLALRACWVILRGGSVAWNVNLTEQGDLEARAGDAFFCDVTVRGKPMTAGHIYHGKPEPQPE